MAEYRKKFVALDLETTHLDMRRGKIMEFGGVVAELSFDEKKKQVIVNLGEKFTTLINPETEPSPESLTLTGIALTELNEAPVWKDVKKKIIEFIGSRVVLGHNVSFDLDYLNNQGAGLSNQTWDTLELATTLLPLLPSHSLESLGEQFAITISTSHRALADSEKTALLLAEILNQFLNLPPDVQQEIKDLISRSDLPWKELLVDLPLVDKKFQSKTPERNKSVKIRPAKLDLSWENKKIYCLPVGFSAWPGVLAEIQSQKLPVIAALSHQVLLEFVPKAAVIPLVFRSLCEIRFERLKKQEVLSGPLAKIVVKILLGRHFGTGIDLGRLKWAYGETEFLHYVLVDKELCTKHGCAFANTISGKKQIEFTNLRSLFELVLHWSVKYKDRKLLLFDLAEVEAKFSEILNESWNLREVRTNLAKIYPIEKVNASLYERVPSEAATLANELDLFFGILHLVYLQSPDEFAQNVILDDEARATDRFGKLFHPAEKLIAKIYKFCEYLSAASESAQGEEALELTALKNRLGSFAEFMKNYFVEPSPENIYWLRFNHAWVDLNIMPQSLGGQWQAFANNFKTVSIADTELPGLSLEYFKNRLGLSGFSIESCDLKTKPRKVEIKIAESPLPDRNFFDLLKRFKGRTLVIVPNETKLGELYTALTEDLQSSTAVLAYKFSGSVHSLFRKAEKHRGEDMVMILTKHALSRIKTNLPEFDQLVIFKLPFEAQGASMSLLGVGRVDLFMGAVLPRAILFLHRILEKFLAAASENPRVFILDHRIWTEYDQAFRKYLEEFADFEISTMERS